jgi:hypothetical protein
MFLLQYWSKGFSLLPNGAALAKRDASDETDKSIDGLIADADAYIQSIQQKIDSIIGPPKA